MGLVCTCGARPPEDALFCHKCGRPLRDEALAIEQEQQREEADSAAANVAPPEALAAPPPLLEISFRNPIAVRVAFLVASLALAGTMLSALSGSMPLYLLAAMFLAPASGFVAVWLYSKRTGQSISVRAGAKLGFITGVFGFVYSTVLNTLTTLSAASKAGLVEQYREQLDRQGVPPETVAQMMKILEAPETLVVILLIGIAISFVLGTMSATVGGAIGAKILDKQ